MSIHSRSGREGEGGRGEGCERRFFCGKLMQSGERSERLLHMHASEEGGREGGGRTEDRGMKGGKEEEWRPWC